MRLVVALALASVFLPGLMATGEQERVAAQFVRQLAASDVPAGYSPAEIRMAYGIDGVDQKTALGRLIAIVVAFHQPHLTDDVRAFTSSFQLAAMFGLENAEACDFIRGPHPCFQRTHVAGTPSENLSWALETALDVEWAHAVSPMADVLLVEATSDRMEHLLTAVDDALMWRPDIVLMAWGSPETSLQLIDDRRFESSRVAFVAAVGDSPEMISYPATSPNVIAVGATSLALDAQGRRMTESAWSQSAGGVSRLEAQPEYQYGVAAALTPRFRAVPDVVASGDLNAGYSVFTSDAGGQAHPWRVAGGSSGAAAVWAGLLSLAARDCSLYVDQQPYVARLYAALTSNASGSRFESRVGFGPPHAQELLPGLCAPGHGRTDA